MLSKKKRIKNPQALKDHGEKEPHCEMCKHFRRTTVPGADVHHIIYKSQQGDDSEENLITLCRDCHIDAHGVESKRFRESAQKIKGTIEVNFEERKIK